MHVIARTALPPPACRWRPGPILIAVGQKAREADQAGALKLLASKPIGLVALWLLGLGFAAYALWRLSEAAFGVTGEGYGARRRLRRLRRADVRRHRGNRRQPGPP